MVIEVPSLDRWEVLGEIYSTLFVVLCYAFTGEFLCGGDIGNGMYRGN
jgi:hypothetical protein